MIAALHAAYCQEAAPSFRHLTINDGLSQSLVNSIAQDSTGFLWLGTQDGLNQFDRYSIPVFSRRTGDSSTISDYLEERVQRKRLAFLYAARGGLNQTKLASGFRRGRKRVLGRG